MAVLRQPWLTPGDGRTARDVEPGRASGGHVDQRLTDGIEVLQHDATLDDEGRLRYFVVRVPEVAVRRPDTDQFRKRSQPPSEPGAVQHRIVMTDQERLHEARAGEFHAKSTNPPLAVAA